MIQMQSNLSIEKSEQQTHDQSRDNYIILRVVYASILIAFLLLVSFYLDLLSDYDALSLVLGFVVSIILQFSFLSYYFRAEMKKYKMDEIGVLKWKIKLLFGELDPKHIDRKNKLKYYRKEGSQKDRLFHKDNQSIYQNVMSFLRGKEEPSFTQIIPKTSLKWDFLHNKMLLLEKFLGQMYRQYEGRRSIYSRYRAAVQRIKEKKEYREWQQFLKEEQPTFSSSASSSHFNRGKARLNWEIFNWFVLQKVKINEKEVVCLKENIIGEYSTYISSVKQSKDKNSKVRETLLTAYKDAQKNKAQIVNQIERISIKYSLIKESLQNNKIKQQQDIEGILKKQFDLRLHKAELQNLQIKISRAQNLILSNSELLHGHLAEEEMQLEDHLNKLNSKFTNYLNMMAGIGDTRSPIVKRYFENQQDFSEEEYPTAELQRDMETLLGRYASRRKFETSFKNYLIQVLNLFMELNNNHSETHALIQEYKPRFQRSSEPTRADSRIKKELTGARLHYYASNVKDLKILKMFEKINSFECKLAEKLTGLLRRQSTYLNDFEEQLGAAFARDLKKSQDDLRRREDDFKKLRRRLNKDEGELVDDELFMEVSSMREKLSLEVSQYLQVYRVSTSLLDITEVMIQNETLYEKYATQLAEEEQFERSNQEADTDDTRARQRYEAYTNCIQRQQNAQFDDDFLINDDYHLHLEKEADYISSKSKSEVQIWSFANYSIREGLLRQNNKEALKMIQLNTFKESVFKSNQMINRLLSVFFNEWTKSEFFHEFVKQQLLISLNRKKPDIVEHLNIEYFKIVERVKSVGPIKNIRIHHSEIYRCLFDLVLDFKGKIAVQIGTKLKISKKPALQIKLLIKEFQCPIRVCFTPYSLGKSYASLLERPKLSIDYSVTLGGFDLTKIPFFTQIIKTYIVLKLRKKMLWPKRMTLAVPLSFKSTLDLAILQRNKYERDKEKLQKKTQ